MIEATRHWKEPLLIKRLVYIGVVFFILNFSGCSEDSDTFIAKGAVNSIKVDTFLIINLSHVVLEGPSFDEKEENELRGKESDAGIFGSKQKKKGFALLEEQRKKRDVEYLALNRYEQLETKRVKRVAKKNISDGFESGRTLPKTLIFGGKGFEVQSFESSFDGKLNVDFHYHINTFGNPSLPPENRDSLDLKENNLRDNRNVVFHQSNTLFNQLDIELKEKLEEFVEEEPVSSKTDEAIPETRVILDQNSKYLLKLRETKDPLDLLSGNEKANKFKFKNP